MACSDNSNHNNGHHHSSNSSEMCSSPETVTLNFLEVVPAAVKPGGCLHILPLRDLARAGVDILALHSQGRIY